MKRKSKVNSTDKPKPSLWTGFKGSRGAKSRPEADQEKLIQAEPWTQGHNLSNKVLTGIVVVGLVVYPFIASNISQSMSPAAPAQVVQAKSAALPTPAQQARATAEGFVSSWLTATSDNSARLARYINVTDARLPKTGSEIREVTAAEIQLIQDNAYLVTVNAEVKDAEGAWQLRAFDVSFVTDDEQNLLVLGLPSERAIQPAKGTKLDGYSRDLSANKPIIGSVEGFLQAYLTGAGDLARFSSPGTNFVATSPAPYTSARLEYIVGDREPGEKLADGETLRVNARVLLIAKTTEALGDFQMTLTARAGRWEITTLGLDDQMVTAQLSRKEAKK
ncbi:conjugal transfer protein [Paeniglutamicibacter gangotriensis]|uniref:conjugal transfer protein n=1 Tax=Paeniglutamicibacter gangotriensis TaxID=254787 RepID=UPI0037CA5B4C